eukprot:GFUD01041796.1.p1 GENE.GFUD01041796.1~~GFUD01041796.1.p1  ORF type:complete len:258 (+),score=54.16 GFUD01041796.1:73-846(+)
MDASKLKTYLKCPVCLDIPRSKIFACSNGHKICESCYDKIRTTANMNAMLCPNGRCKYDNPPRRNRDLEYIVENSDVKLSCSRPLCQVEMAKDNLLKHEVECEFRTVPCPHTTCEKEIVFKQVEDHIKRVHQDVCRVLQRPKKRIMNSLLHNCDWKLYVWEQCKVQFYPQIVKRNGDWYFWVKIKEGPIVASQWKFSVKMENKDTGYRMEFSGSVHPVDLKVDQQMETGDCLRMSSKNVEKLQDVKECFKIEFKVFK